MRAERAVRRVAQALQHAKDHQHQDALAVGRDLIDVVDPSS